MRVIIKVKPNYLDEIIQWLRERGYEPYAISRRFNIIAVDIPISIIHEIKKLDYVEEVTKEEFVVPTSFLSWLQAEISRFIKF